MPRVALWVIAAFAPCGSRYCTKAACRLLWTWFGIV